MISFVHDTAVRKASNSAKGREKINREGEVLSKVSGPNIVQLLAHADGELLLERIDGVELSDLYRSLPLSGDAVLHVAHGILNALEAAHAARIVHGDISPRNVMVARSGRVVVIDFGNAITTGTISASTRFRGTLAYASPEQLRLRPLDGRSDLYSLGAVLYELLSGHRFRSGGQQSLYDDALRQQVVLPLHVVVPHVASTMTDIVMRLVAFDRGDRYQTVQDVRDALPPSTEAHQACLMETLGGLPHKQTRRGRRKLVAAVPIVALLGGFVGWPAGNSVTIEKQQHQSSTTLLSVRPLECTESPASSFTYRPTPPEEAVVTPMTSHVAEKRMRREQSRTDRSAATQKRLLTAASTSSPQTSVIDKREDNSFGIGSATILDRRAKTVEMIGSATIIDKRGETQHR